MADLLATRYPALAVVREAWRCGRDIRVLEQLPGDGAALLRLAAEDSAFVIGCDPRLSALYGRSLSGEGASALAPDGDVTAEIGAAVENGCELLIEDTVTLSAGPTRMARLYLPLKRTPDDELLCVVAISRGSALD